MPDIRHSISIEAPAERVYPLVATMEGLSRWWAADVSEDKASGAVEIGFFNRATIYRLRLLKSTPSEVEWLCETGQEWSGTRLLFHLKAEGGRTRLRFTHAGWREQTDYFVDCTTTWGGLMFRLKAAAEAGLSAPLFLRAGLAS